jgi:hypothetical protein
MRAKYGWTMADPDTHTILTQIAERLHDPEVPQDHKAVLKRFKAMVEMDLSPPEEESRTA